MDGWTIASRRDVERPANDGTDSGIIVRYRTVRVGYGCIWPWTRSRTEWKNRWRWRTSDWLCVKDSVVTGIEVWDYTERTVSRRLRVEAVPSILARATHTYPDGSCSAVVAPSYAGTDVAARPIVDVHRRVWLRSTAQGGKEAWKCWRIKSTSGSERRWRLHRRITGRIEWQRHCRLGKRDRLPYRRKDGHAGYRPRSSVCLNRLSRMEEGRPGDCTELVDAGWTRRTSRRCRAGDQHIRRRISIRHPTTKVADFTDNL